jgi:hypothetical protein
MKKYHIVRSYVASVSEHYDIVATSYDDALRKIVVDGVPSTDTIIFEPMEGSVEIDLLGEMRALPEERETTDVVVRLVH